MKGILLVVVCLAASATAQDAEEPAASAFTFQKDFSLGFENNFDASTALSQVSSGIQSVGSFLVRIFRPTVVLLSAVFLLCLVAQLSIQAMGFVIDGKATAFQALSTLFKSLGSSVESKFDRDRRNVDFPSHDDLMGILNTVVNGIEAYQKHE